MSEWAESGNCVCLEWQTVLWYEWLRQVNRVYLRRPNQKARAADFFIPLECVSSAKDVESACTPSIQMNRPCHVLDFSNPKEIPIGIETVRRQSILQRD